MTYKVHEEVELNGDVYDEEDSAGWRYRVRRHHHVRIVGRR